MRISFKLKLIFSYVFVVLFSFGFIAFFLDKKLEENSVRNIKASLITQARLIESQVNIQSLAQEDIIHLEPLIKSLSAKTECRITIINNRGRVLADSEKLSEEIPQMENHLYRPEVRAALAGQTGIDMRYSSTLRIGMLYVALPIQYQNGVLGVLRLSLPLTGVQKTLVVIRKIIFMGVIFALIFAFILGSIVASRTIVPINNMIKASRRFSNGDFSRRIIQASGDEVGELAATLNKMAQDIEDKIKEVKSQNQKLAAIFNSMIEGVIVVDRFSNIISINPTIEKLFNVLRSDVEGKAFLEVIRNNNISEIITNVLKGGQSLSVELSLVSPVRKIFEVNAAPIYDNNEVGGCLIVIHDISEIRRLETIRSDFVANVSHELKTPLTSIKGFIETLLEGALEDKENNRNFLKIIHVHAQRLDSLVNDLLSLSYLESKEIRLNKANFSIRRAVDTIIQGFNSQLRKKEIEVVNELPNEFLLNADKSRMEQVFTNLIDNAIKFNKEKGSIKIYALETAGAVKVFIEDTGLGIPDRDIPRIFERFYRVDKARSRELGGTGLGLSIVKHIIELHGGCVGVESVEGLGSKFWFSLPK